MMLTKDVKINPTPAQIAYAVPNGKVLSANDKH